MKKLRLELEDLDVQSFPTGEAQAAGGTVEAREVTAVRCNTDQSCGAGTCALSCDGVCGTYFCPPVGDLTADGCEQASALCTFEYGGGCVYA
jgi:hypothetical protein